MWTYSQILDQAERLAKDKRFWLFCRYVVSDEGEKVLSNRLFKWRLTRIVLPLPV
jgi:hypothetical protein